MQKASEPGPIKYPLFPIFIYCFQQQTVADTWKQYKTRKAYSGTSHNCSSIIQHFMAQEILSRLVSLHLIVIFCEFGWLLSEQISICNTLRKSISLFSDLLCDICSKCRPVRWFHLLLPTSGIRRHSALLFPTSPSPSHSCFHRSLWNVSSTQDLYRFYTEKPATPNHSQLCCKVILLLTLKVVWIVSDPA